MTCTHYAAVTESHSLLIGNVSNQMWSLNNRSVDLNKLETICCQYFALNHWLPIWPKFMQISCGYLTEIEDGRILVYLCAWRRVLSTKIHNEISQRVFRSTADVHNFPSVHSNFKTHFYNFEIKEIWNFDIFLFHSVVMGGILKDRNVSFRILFIIRCFGCNFLAFLRKLS